MNRNNLENPADRKAAAHNDEARYRSEQLFAKVCRLIDAGLYDSALGQLKSAEVSDTLKNAKGVCLLRLGRYEEALRLFRNLTLKSGTMWMRPELPLIYRTNFCTALLLAGHPGGCVASLAEIQPADHPSVVRLREAVEQWKRHLSVWQRFLWMIGQEPNHPVTLNFPPGDLHDPVLPKSGGVN